jgi:hypothetical protein
MLWRQAQAILCCENTHGILRFVPVAENFLLCQLATISKSDGDILTSCQNAKEAGYWS